jgi:DNA-directed RNA polymerase subunit RPC12/RpoP
MKNGVLIFGATVVCFGIVLIGGTLKFGWPVEWALRIGILSVAGFLLFFLVRWHAHSYAYECPECGHKFSISTVTDFISPHYPDQKYLRCPACHQRYWCHEIPGSLVTVEADSAQPPEG